MKHLIPIIAFVVWGSGLSGQELYPDVEGKVSYVTSQNVYVKFQSTENITRGDTLFTASDGQMVPSLVVRDVSSISCVCVPLSSREFMVGDLVISRQKAQKPLKIPEKALVPAPVPGIVTRDSAANDRDLPRQRTQSVSGSLSVASYLNFSDVSANSQRMKYNFSMLIQNIGNSRISAETNMTFAHKLGDWSSVQDDIFNGLKIYSLAVNYAVNEHNNFWLGRKINPRISNTGAIDGVQYELKTKFFTIGLIAGTRPDYRNYSFNASLFQFGGYLGHDLAGKHGSMQTTVAFIDQMNHGVTDRRFTYLQHTNSLVKNLFFFGSAEVDLYKKTMNQVDTAVSKDTTYTKDYAPQLSNLYVSLRYRPVRQLSISLSYSSRQNVIYYESYKSLVDRLLEAATVQGFILQANYQPVKLLSLGVNAGYRNSKKDPRPSKNLYGYLTLTDIPGTGIAATVSATLLETGYMSGGIYSLGVSRDLVPGKITSGLNYRYVRYKFYSGEANLVQHMGEVNFTWRILRRLSCGVYYEGSFDKTSVFNRIYINITQRF